MIRSIGADGGIEIAGAFLPIDRPRVRARIASAAAQPIVLLIAPAGYGKSVALRQYLASLNEPFVRFDLVSQHGALPGFLRGLAEALAEVAPHLRTTLAGAFDRNRSSGAPVDDLASWMQTHLKAFRGLVAIDDLHVAEGDPEVAGFLVALIEGCKGNVRWLLASRSTVGLPIGTWLARGESDLAVGEGDLQFTLAEAKATARSCRLGVREVELSDLLSLTEGWPAALTFALRSATRSTDLRNLAAITREMVYRFLAEQVYATLDIEARALLAVATALPKIDVAVLQLAGFDRALQLVEGLRAQTAFIHQEAPGVYRCHDLFREFVRHEIALEGRTAVAAIHKRAALALEAAGDIENALSAYIDIEACDDVVRLLEREGPELLETARADVVARAIDGLGQSVRQGNARVLALRGMLDGTAGKYARAETHLRRSLVLAADDPTLCASIRLRLALLAINQGRDARGVLLPVAQDATQPVGYRIEALSLYAVACAIIDDGDGARAAVAQVDELLPSIDLDATRAKVLQRIGVASRRIGDVDRAVEALTQANELADELHLYSLASRACAVLSNLALHERDDLVRQLWYAGQASAAAAKAGDAFDVQTALMQMLCGQTRRGDFAQIVAIEERLVRIHTSDPMVALYVNCSKATRASWEGRFSEAYVGLRAGWGRLHFGFDRAMVGSQCAVFLALDGRREEAIVLTRDVVETVSALELRGPYRERAAAITLALCAIAEEVNGRTTHAHRLLRRLRQRKDPVIALVVRAVDGVVSCAAGRGEPTSQELAGTIDQIAARSYGDVARLLSAIQRELRERTVKAVPDDALTRSERAILSLLAEGLSPKEIAARNDRSIYTIRAHIANATAKLHAHGRTQAIASARRRGLLETS